MKLRSAALFMIVWFACQQVIAGVSVFPFPSNSMPDRHVSVHCHDDQTNDTAHDKTPTESHNNTVQSFECCDIGCQCCIGGCQSVPGNSLSQILIHLSVHPVDSYLFILPKVPSSLLFRPPIIA